MKRSPSYMFALALLLFISAVTTSRVVLAQQAATPNANAKPADVDRIIREFSAKETQFRHALNEYAFKRDAVIQVLGMGGQIAGEYHRVSQFTFDDQGNRYEKIIFFPMPSYAGITAEDIEDLSGVNPFALEAGKIDKYNFTYVGKERIDELNLYIFDVSPKVMPDPKKTKERLFMGRIWVDDQDLQIVKSRGKGVPETKENKFPNVETYREQIDGRYWFPTYSYADEDLVFGDGSVTHIRLRVKYSDFVKGHASVIIKDVEGDDKETTPNQKPTPDKHPTAPPTETEGQAPPTGVLNSRAIELPQPVYPEEAKAKHVTGTVKVAVTVDEQGNVIDAQAIEGPKELRAAAVEAAKKARFGQTRLHGALIKVYGELVYKF
jgi:TonB family protein